ncbi:ABC transporter substrate-binding protein [Photobacterium sp. R1]
MSEANLRRLNQLLSKYQYRTVYSVVVEELEAVLSTSRRNTSTIMSKLCEAGWIDWFPSVGRSKASTLMVKVSLQEAICSVLQPEIASGHFGSVSKLLSLYGATAVRALSQVTEKQNAWNEANNQLLITRYPWVDTIDPAKTYRIAELQVIKSVYDTLLIQDQQGRLLPGIAHAWETEDNDVTLWIRRNIRRHDGEFLTVEDVIASLERLVIESGPVSYLFSQIASISQLSAHSLRIRLKAQNPLFLHALAVPHASIVTRDVRHYGDSRQAFVGTGPFCIEAWDDDKLVLNIHPAYFRQSALLDRITLSHQGGELSEYLGQQSQDDGIKETYTLQSFSYLTARFRKDAEILPEDLEQLIDYIAAKRNVVDGGNVVSGLSFSAPSDSAPPADLKLEGKLILTEPRWTIPHLAQLAQWLHGVIRETGLELEVIELTDISNPSLMKDRADVLFLEEVMELPHKYGVYEWMLASSGLRFLYAEPESWRQHQRLVDEAVSLQSPADAFVKIEQDLLASRQYLPLFFGKEEILNVCQVRGIQVTKTGYSDFHKLWIDGE